MNGTAVHPDRVGPARGRLTPGEWMLLGVVGLAFLHHVDHVLRADNSGWPFTSDVTPFTISLLVYPIFAIDFLLLRGRPWVRVGLALSVAVSGLLSLAVLLALVLLVREARLRHLVPTR
jgi:hypothetical protein